ncbi:protein disulfide isomerase CRELD1 isoform X2 [Notolabrus celidotus]|uniref:protein disulfide isomerase CRELD1 isoform X2 n=1 Tax=Notolabrus celidotus TaxID=1203425 RepID=UPI00148FD32C|nr:protein disulfide isomerase CRELD1 isoform X2 [Notolabrus celidotus]
MGLRMLHMLQAALLCCSLAVAVHSCPQPCKKCSDTENNQCEECRAGWTLHHNTCVDIDECDTVLGICPANSYCFNTEGSFKCRDCDLACVGCMGSGPARCRKCASGYKLTGPKCLGVQEKGLFEDIQDDEVEVLQQMFFGVVLCALATLAAKGDMVYTSVFMGAVAAMAGYWLSDRGDRLLDNFLKGR